MYIMYVVSWHYKHAQRLLYSLEFLKIHYLSDINIQGKVFLWMHLYGCLQCLFLTLNVLKDK